MLYLLRHPEIGKEPRPEKSKARRDIIESLEALAPGVRVSIGTGRIYVESDSDLRAVLEQLHGVTSFSPCERCEVAEVGARVVALAREALAGGKSFAVRVRRVGQHAFGSQELARELGARVLAEVAGSRVDLKQPEVELGVEVRDGEAYVFHEVIAGLDERALPERRPYEEPRFVVDHMLGTLATRLRLLGFDVTFYRDTADSLLLRKSDDERRTLLTQDRGLARLGAGSAYFVLARGLEEQVREVLEHFALRVDEGAVLSRCSLCNERIEPVEKGAVRELVPARVFEAYDEFFRCPACNKVYWKGSHHERMRLI
jgi:uncharacterized protein